VSEWPFGAQPIDANVFIDDDKDQTAWLYFGGHRRCVAVKLKPDMNRLDGDFHLITPKGGEEVGGYVEGPFMFKRNGLYYFMWSEGDWTDHTYGVAYAISDSPTGPFDRIGRVLTGDAVHGRGAGHNSVLRLPGTDTHLIAYHRRPIGETASNHRVSCIDVMRFRRDGTIEEVEMT
jgi:beta-xylosidase